MQEYRRYILGLAVIIIIITTACTSNLKSLPDSIEVKPSLSIPVSDMYFTLDTGLILQGLPQINLSENVPEWAKHTFVYKRDTIPFNLTEAYDEADYIEKLTIKLNMWNEFPIEGAGFITFLDENYLPIDVIPSDTLRLDKAGYYSDGTTIGTRFSNTKVIFDAQRIENLRNAQYVEIFTGLYVTDEDITEENVSFFNSYKIRVQIAAQIDFKVVSN